MLIIYSKITISFYSFIEIIAIFAPEKCVGWSNLLKGLLLKKGMPCSRLYREIRQQYPLL